LFVDVFLQQRFLLRRFVDESIYRLTDDLDANSNATGAKICKLTNHGVVFSRILNIETANEKFHMLEYLHADLSE
jgi:hypothetical protein